MEHEKAITHQIDTLKELRQLTEMNRREFCEYMGIPLRTVEEWEAGRRKMPDYVLRLISYRIHTEKFLKDKHIDYRGIEDEKK